MTSQTGKTVRPTLRSGAVQIGEIYFFERNQRLRCALRGPAVRAHGDTRGVQKKRGGGPKSTIGKQASSQNATKHGGRATVIRILPGEDPEEFERVKNGWLTEYEPEGHMEETLANNLIESEWLLLRARRNRFNAEARAVGEGKEPHEWTAEDNHQVELMQRYLTTAERSFYRAFNAMQGLRRTSCEKRRMSFRWSG